MSFLPNRHDTWQRFGQLHREPLSATGIPASILHAENRFRELLREGLTNVGKDTASLTHLNDSEWLALERFAILFFREYESCEFLALFPAFHPEMQRRGRRVRSDLVIERMSPD